MKQVLILFVSLAFTATGYSQEIKLYRNSGGDQVFDLGSIDSIKFLPFECGDSLVYADKTYHSVLIGSQCWLKENLDVGTMITGNLNQYNNSILEKYCYNNDPGNCTTYGGLYQWDEAMQWVYTEAKGICPTGWHIPALAELQILAAAVGNDGNALKEIGQGTGEGAGTNTSGFSALLAGIRHTSRVFQSLGTDAIFWSSERNDPWDSYFMRVNYIDSIIIIGYYNMTNGFSVRCLKN